MRRYKAPKRESKVIAMRVPKEIYAELRSLAMRNLRTISEEAGDALKLGLQQTHRILAEAKREGKP